MLSLFSTYLVLEKHLVNSSLSLNTVAVSFDVYFFICWTSFPFWNRWVSHRLAHHIKLKWMHILFVYLWVSIIRGFCVEFRLLPIHRRSWKISPSFLFDSYRLDFHSLLYPYLFALNRITRIKLQLMSKSIDLYEFFLSNFRNLVLKELTILW